MGLLTSGLIIIRVAVRNQESELAAPRNSYYASTYTVRITGRDTNERMHANMTRKHDTQSHTQTQTHIEHNLVEYR